MSTTTGSGIWAKQLANHPHLILGGGGGGVGGEVGDLRRDIANVLKNLASICVVEYTNPALAAAAGLEAATATTVAPRTVTAFLSPGLAALLADGRNLTFTTAGGTAADAPANAVITGTDMDGKAQTETVNLAQTAAAAAGVKVFKTISSVAYAAADGTGATVSIGFGVLLGLPLPFKARAGLTNMVLKEIAAGAVVTNGTFSATNRSYSPNTAPDGTNDYAVYYEFDASVIADG